MPMMRLLRPISWSGSVISPGETLWRSEEDAIKLESRGLAVRVLSAAQEVIRKTQQASLKPREVAAVKAAPEAPSKQIAKRTGKK